MRGIGNDCVLFPLLIFSIGAPIKEYILQKEADYRSIIIKIKLCTHI